MRAQVQAKAAQIFASIEAGSKTLANPKAERRYQERQTAIALSEQDGRPGSDPEARAAADQILMTLGGYRERDTAARALSDEIVATIRPNRKTEIWTLK